MRQILVKKLQIKMHLYYKQTIEAGVIATMSSENQL